MGEAMVTGRMDERKKTRGGRVLRRYGLNASQAINLMYDRIIEEESANFLTDTASEPNTPAWRNAAEFVDALSSPRASRFDDMSKAEIRIERLEKRGLK